MSSDANLRTAISARRLAKCYHLYDRPSDRLKQAFFRSRRYYAESWGLRDVSFDILPGEVVGIVGRNGAGKSTLLQIIAGILAPSSGEVRRTGTVFPLLEIGTGFNPEFTGRENVLAGAAIMGLSSSEARAAAPLAIDFAELGPYIDRPVKTYSSGMYARLAMSLALHLPADIILIDEILSVGDVFFQIKCYDRVQQIINSGRTALICSHDLGAVRRYCSRVICLAGGRLLADGPPDEVLALYLQSGGIDSPDALNRPESLPSPPAPHPLPTQHAAPAPPRIVQPSIRIAPDWHPDERFSSLVRNPRGLALLPDGNLLIADLFSHLLVESDPSGKVLRTWGSPGFGEGRIYDPVGIDLMPDGRIAVADYTSGRLSAMTPDGRAVPLFDGADLGPQAFCIRFSPDRCAWVSSRGDGGVRVVSPDGSAVPLSLGPRHRRYITDCAFRGPLAYLSDFRNSEILVVSSHTLELVNEIPLSAVPRAKAPHGIALVGRHLLLTCHDSHSLVVLPLDPPKPDSALAVDLRPFLIEHPCYIVVDGATAWISASTLGSVTALDLSSLIEFGVDFSEPPVALAST